MNIDDCCGPRADPDIRARDALTRYDAMAGLCNGLPEEFERQAEKDRAAFGERYLYIDRTTSEFRWSSVHVLRFLVEVCGIPYAEARASVVSALQGFDVATSLPAPEVMARTIFEAHGDLILAIKQVRMEIDALCRKPHRVPYVRKVLHCLETIPLDELRTWNRT